MTSRRFNSATVGDQDNYLIVNAGNINTLGQGAWTVGWIWNPTNNTHEGGVFRSHNGGTLNNDVRIYNWDSGSIFLSITGAASPYSAGAWFVYFVTKPAGNGATCRSHEYSYGTSTWTHANFSGTVDGTGTNTNDQFAIGTLDKSTQGMRGDLHIMGAWTRELSDSEIASGGFHSALTNWLAASPGALWLLNQASTATAVTDSTGGGAGQNTLNKTSVQATQPPGFDDSLPQAPNIRIVQASRRLP